MPKVEVAIPELRLVSPEELVEDPQPPAVVKPLLCEIATAPTSRYPEWVIELVGRPAASGSYADVFRVRHGDRDLAVKRLRNRWGADRAAYRRRCEAEIERTRAVTKLDVPGVVRYEGSFDDRSGNACLLTQWVEGVTGEELLDQHTKGCPEAMARTITKSLLETLQGLWQHGVLHRDVKLDNVVVGEGGAVTLLDFGHAVFVDKAELAGQRCVPMSKGTNPAFLPPFVRNGSVAAADVGRVDLYSAGRCALALLCGANALLARDHHPLPDFAGHELSAEAEDFLAAVLGEGPDALLTVAAALRHPWLTGSLCLERSPVLRNCIEATDDAQ